MATLRSGMLAAAVTALLLQGACDDVSKVAGPPDEASFSDGFANTSTTLDLHAIIGQPGEFLLIYELKGKRGQRTESREGPGLSGCLTDVTLTIPRKQATGIGYPYDDSWPWVEIAGDLSRRAAVDSLGPVLINVPKGQWRNVRTIEYWESYVIDVWVYFRIWDHQNSQYVYVDWGLVKTIEIWHLQGWVDASTPCDPSPPNPHGQGAGG